jgi:molybdopterin-binding protein
MIVIGSVKVNVSIETDNNSVTSMTTNKAAEETANSLTADIKTLQLRKRQEQQDNSYI